MQWVIWREILVPQPLGLLWFCLAGATFWAFRTRRRWQGLFLGILVGATWLAGATPCSAWLLASLERPYVRDSLADVPIADAVVMLGGTHDASRLEVFDMNLADTADRILTAAELVRQGKAPSLVLGGGEHELRGERRPESDAVVRWLKEWGVLAAAPISLGPCATTRVEVERTRQLMQARGWKKIILVTSASHLRRAMALCRSAGIEAVAVGCDFQGLTWLAKPVSYRVFPRHEQIRLLSLYWHEQLGWAYYRLRGWI